MELEIEGKVAAVAASSNGLGLASAVELAKAGARVGLCGRDSGRLEAAVRQVEAGAKGAHRDPGAVLGIVADLATEAGPSRFIDAIEERLGQVDILVVNNGGPAAGGPLALGPGDWQRAFELTFLSATRLVSRVAPGMVARRWGRIIFLTSTSVKQPIGDLALSTSIRSAVTAYAKTLSDELARHGVTVNSVAPGATLTERLRTLIARRAAESGKTEAESREALESSIPARRLGRPEELAAAVAFLASARASYITGVVLPVDGGAVRSLA